MTQGVDAATRRGFLLGLFGGLAGALGLATAPRLSEGPAAPPRAPAPNRAIDNIFEPLIRTTQQRRKP